MSKTLIDLDPELVEAAASVLGTKTKKDTVTAALRAAVADAAQRREMAALTAGSWANQDDLDANRNDAWSR